MTDAKQWIIRRCTQRLRPAQRIGRFELIYEDFDVEPVTNTGEAQFAGNSDDELPGRHMANCRCPEQEHFKKRAPETRSR